MQALVIDMPGTWVTEKFGQKLGAITACWSFHLLWHHLLPLNI